MKEPKFFPIFILFIFIALFTRSAGEDKIPSEKIQVKANVWETKEHGAGDFFPNLTMDGDLSANSSWRGEKIDDIKPWILYDLGKTVQLSHLNIAFFKGDQRNYSIEILISKDGTNWITIFDGLSSGNTAVFEKYPIGENARFIKIVGNGNSNETFNNWTNITEVEIYMN